MRSRNNILIFILILLFLNACGTRYSAYEKDIDAWHKKRIDNLKKTTGWLSLAGLYWLKPGENTFGSDSTNALIFPAKAPDFIGSFFLEGSTVRIMINPDLQVKSNGKTITSAILKSDISGETTKLKLDTYQWYLIQRGAKTGIRLKDTTSTLLQSFNGIERYPVQKSWRIKARLIPAERGHSITVPNVLGQMEATPSPGLLQFEYSGKTHTLETIKEDGDDQYWIIFGDLTNGDETYGGGRFLYVDTVDKNGETFIDFNKAYNPPCVFTPFATCPLPPLGNKLDIAVQAGEKMFGATHH